MKKTKFIVGALVLSMGLVGTGYALWNDTLEIKSTVNTGNFNVQFEGITKSFYYQNDTNEMKSYDPTNNKFVTMGQDTRIVEQTGVGGVEVDNASDAITFDVSNLVPGGMVQFDTVIKNTGDVAAVLKEVTASSVGISYSEELKEKLHMSITAWDTTQGPNERVNILPYEWVKIGEIPYTIKVAEDKEQTILSLNQSPEDQINLTVAFKLDKDAENDTQGKDATVEIKLNFEQLLQSATGK
ncbi:MAG: hypothetical protein RR490_00085 [Niameybacter sp.]